MVKRRNIFLSILDVVFIAITIVLGIALFFAEIARWVNPQTTTFFAFFALGWPLLYFANFVVFCVWLARWKRWALVSGFVFFFGIAGIGDYVQLDWLKKYHDERKNDELSVFTYNTHNLRSQYFGPRSTLDMVCNKANEVRADLVFLQEFSLADSSELALFDSLMAAYPYRAFQYNVDEGFAYAGQTVLSRYPLSTPHTVSFQGSENSIIVVDMYRSSDTLRLFGCHLQTTSFNSVSNEMGLRSVVKSDKSDSLARTAVAAMADNFRLRAVQADTLASMIATSPYSVVVAGDFNSPPATYTYSKIRGDLGDAFCEAGSGYGYTYKPMKGFFRIDYVLFDDDRYRATSYLSPNLPYSDHNPVIVRLIKR